MFPGVDGFHWTVQHVVFLSLFFCVLATIGATVIVAWVRAARQQNPESVRWHSEFEDLPARDRKCRQVLRGDMKARTCPNGFDCGQCHEFRPAADKAMGSTYGLVYPENRLYHRGHTWVEPQADGTALVGLDDFARRVMGVPESVELPAVGTRLTRNGAAWKVRQGGTVVRILAPLDGEVVAVGDAGSEWVLRVKAEKLETTHLLRGAEVSGWLRDELERLQILLTPAGATPTLADGGVLVEDLHRALPEANWDAVLSELTLQA
ncbi:MAG: glycine cleavage system protein H [Bryobacteraceae bacterium]